MTKLICPDCRRENEPERIYCHDCGARLDRSGLAKEASKEEDPQVTHRRVKAIFDARGVKMRQRFFQISKLLLGSLAAAAIIQMVRAPDLPPTPKGVGLPRQINLDLESAAMAPGALALQYGEPEVNAYLAYVLKGKQTALSKWLNFERAHLDLEEGYAKFTAERSLFGFALFTTGSFAFSLQNGAVKATPRGGQLGRLPLHPALVGLVAPFLFGDVAAAFDRERKSIGKLGAVEIHPQTLSFAPRQP